MRDTVMRGRQTDGQTDGRLRERVWGDEVKSDRQTDGGTDS